MVGDAKILIAACKRRLGHRLQRIDAVGTVGMRVQGCP